MVSDKFIEFIKFISNSVRSRNTVYVYLVIEIVVVNYNYKFSLFARNAKKT
jgi:hypothetical protein